MDTARTDPRYPAMETPPHAVIARFENTAVLMGAARRVRDAGYRNWDVITPFPVHGLDGVMGLTRSKVPRFALIGGATGFSIGMLMVAYMNWIDYPLIVGGKPYFSPIFAFPVAYELTILFAAFGTIIGMFLLNRLPMHYHPVLKYDDAARAMDDTFHIVIETSDPEYTETGTREFLTELGATEISYLED